MALYKTGNISDELEGSYLPTPDLSLPEDDSKQSSLLDLLVPASNGNFAPTQKQVDPIDQKLAAFKATPTSPSTLAAPTYFDYDRSQAARYVQADDYKTLGFNPAAGQENEFRYGARQTWGDVWSNGLTGMFKLAGNTFIEGWKGWGNLFDAVHSEGKWFDGSKLMGSGEELLAQDKATKDIMNKYAIFATPESEEGVFNKKFFGDMLQQSGFAVGTIGQVLSEELLTWGLSTEFSLAKLGLKAPAWAGKVVTKAEIAADLTKLGNPIWKASSVGEALVQGARKMIPLADTVYTATKYKKAGAGALQIASIGLGGLRRTLSEANMAMTEARMESAGTYAELYNKLYDEEVLKTGDAPSADKLSDIERISKDAAYDNFQVNTGVLMLSNRLQFDNLFSKFKLGREVLGVAGEYADDVLNVAGKRMGAEGIEDFSKMYTKGKLGTFGLLGDIATDFGKKKAAWEATKSLGKNLFKWEASEGIQELIQEGSNKALVDYYYDLYHGNKGDLQKSINLAAESQVNVQGLKTFLMGAVTGRLLSPINYTIGQVKYFASTDSDSRKEHELAVANAVDTINAFYTDKTKVLNEHIANVKVQNKAAKNMEEAIQNRDHYVFSNNKDSAFAKLVSTAMKTNMFEAVTDTIREYGSSFDDDQFKEAFGLDRTENNIKSVKEFFGKIADETVSFQKNWKSLKDKYGDAVLTDLYKDGTPEREIAISAKRALDDALEILATNNHKATRAAERAVELQTKMAATPVLGSSLAAAFRNIGVTDNTQKEIEILSKEIEAMTQTGVTLDKSGKELLKAKKNQVQSLKNWLENYEFLKQTPDRKDKRKNKKAIKSLQDYINSKNSESKIDTVIKDDELASHYEDLLDYIDLNKDHKDYIDAYNVLANPINFVKVHKRLMDASDEAKNKLKAEHLKEIEKALKSAQQGPPPAAGTKVQSLEDYLKEIYQSQVDSESFEGTFEEWLNSPAANTFLDRYNKKYNTNETLDALKGKAEDVNVIDALEKIKTDLTTLEYTVQSINDVVASIAKVLKTTVDSINDQYKKYLDLFSEEEINAELNALDIDLNDYNTPEEKHIAISKVFLPKFVNKLIENKKNEGKVIIEEENNYDIFDLPKPVVKTSKPIIYTKSGESLVDDGKEGVFIIENKEKIDEDIKAKFAAGMAAGGTKLIETSANVFYIVVNSDRKEVISGKSKGFTRYATKEEAIQAREKDIEFLKEEEKKASAYYTFDGQQIRPGLVLQRAADGKEYVVVTKGGPIVYQDPSKPPAIQVKELRTQDNGKRVKLDQGYTLVKLEGFSIKQKVETTGNGEVIDQNVFRLVRTNELNRIYPHQNREAGESKEAAQARLDNILKTTPVEDLQKNITVKIKQFSGDRKETVVGSTSQKTANKNLKQYSDKYQIQILYKGEILGYLTNYDTFRFVDDNGKFREMSDLTIDQFRKIFNVNGKDINIEIKEFKKNYENSKKIAMALSKFIKPGEEVLVSNEELNKILNLSIGKGEFDYVEENQKGVKFSELPYKTINGFYYIIDNSRRYGKGYTYKTTKVAKTNAIGKDKKAIENEIDAALSSGLDVTEQTGRYTAVVKLPNGVIKFITLSTEVIGDDELNNFINQLNERSKLTKEKNTEKKVIDGKERVVRKNLDFNLKLNTELSEKMFIALPISEKGTYVNVALTDTGNLEVQVFKKSFDSDKRRVVTISGPTLSDPIEITSIDDLIAKINNAFIEHDKNEKIGNDDKIGFSLTRSNFKVSTKDVLDTEKDLPNLNTNVTSDVVKNISLSVEANSKLSAPTVGGNTTTTIITATPAEVALVKAALKDPRVTMFAITGNFSDYVNTTYASKYGNKTANMDEKIAQLYADLSKTAPAARSKNDIAFFNFVNNELTTVKVTREEIALAALKSSLASEIYSNPLLSKEEETNEIAELDRDLDDLRSALLNNTDHKYKYSYTNILSQTEEQLSPLQKVKTPVKGSKPVTSTSGVFTPTTPYGTPTGSPITTSTESILAAQDVLVKLQEELNILNQDKKNKIDELTKAKVGSIGFIKAKKEAEAEANALYNDKITSKQQEINAKRNLGNTVLKVLDKPKFDENSIVAIAKFKEYVKSILGDAVSVEDLNILTDNLNKQNLTVGRFITYMEMLRDGSQQVKGRIEVGKNTPFKYHEAFHAAFRLMLSNKEIEKLLGYAKIDFKNKLKAGETVSSKMEEMRKLHVIYSTMSDKELEERMYEEHMADEFDSWKLKKGDTKVLTGIAGFFQKILDFIQSFFNRSAGSNIEAFFKDIDRGRYRNSKVRNNKFTDRDALNVTEPALKAIKVGTISVQDENGIFVPIDKYLPQQEGEKLSSTIASMFHTRVLAADGLYNKKEVLLDIINQFKELYNVEGANQNFYEAQMMAYYNEDPDEADSYYNRLMEKFAIFNEEENIANLLEAVDTHLQIMGFKQELEEDDFISTEDDFGSRVTTDNWKETFSIGGFGSLSQFLRQYIASTTFTVEKDEFGNSQFINGEPLIQAVNANLVYNGVLKSVANISDQNKFVARLFQIEKNNNTETGKFLNKFFNDVDLEFDKNTNTFNIKNTKQATLFQSVVKGFQQYSVDDLFINKDINSSKKVSKIMLANRMGAAKSQITQWQNAYVEIFQTPILRLNSENKFKFAKERTSSLEDLLTLLDPSESISDNNLTTYAQEISNGIKEELGIALAPTFLEFSIASAKIPEIRTEEQQRIVDLYDDVEPIDLTTVKQIIKSVQALEDPFAKNIDTDKLANQVNVTDEDTEEEPEEVDDMGTGGTITRLNNVAKSNAIFDETVNTTSYTNAENELVYGYQLPTFHLAKINELNSQEYLDSLAEDEYLSNNFLLKSEKFRSILGKLRVKRIGGMKSSILTEDEKGNLREDKTIQSNQNKGVTYGKFSPREFFVSLVDLYSFTEKVTTETETILTTPHLIRVLEASNTADTVGLPVIKAVSTNEETQEVNLTEEALDILYKEVEREFNRIRTVIDENKTKIFPQGEIEGHHYAIDDNGKRIEDDGKKDPKKTPRGLKFFNTADMLGSDLASELENDSTDLSFNIESKKDQILSRIKDYWKEEIDLSIEALKDMNVINSSEKDGVETINNNLFDDFITKGFKIKKDGKLANDERKNDELNIIPNNFKHNFTQVYINDFINTLSINQLLYGDESKAFKNAIDQVKRARGANGAGPSLESVVTAKELGITEKFTESYIFQFTDPMYKANFSGGTKELADAQSFQSVKSARYTLFGLGQLTPFVAKILDKLEEGISLTQEEIFGEGGLKDIEAMLNSKKLVYFDGPLYIKTSVVILTKELTSVKVHGKWEPMVGCEELHELRERLEKFERDNNTVAFACPKSASKGIKQNIYDHTRGFEFADDKHFTKQQTKYWRLQLVNPSNKIEITDPTQAKQIIISEQDDNLEVSFMGQTKDENGKPLTIGKLKNLYLEDNSQRLKNNFTRTRNEIFDIDEAFSELGKTIDQNKITTKLYKFQKRAIETLRSTGADSQLLEFFAVDETTKTPKYNLNNPVTLDKYTQLFLAYFSKGVMSEKIPGHSVALMSNYGLKVVKTFTGKYDENGVPIGTVVRRDVVKQYPSLYKNAKRWDNDNDRNFEGLVKGDIYVDDLRHNVPEFDEKGNIIGRYAEFMMPPHFLEDMNLKPGDPIPEHLLKIFGVRIPSQDKHSFISLRLVDFMPAFYGSTAVFPHELVEISGADFDIDKLYMHIMDTYSKNNKRVAYGKETSKEGKFEEFVRWHSANNKDFKDTLRELKEADPTYQKLLKDLSEQKVLEKNIDKIFDNTQQSDADIKEGFNAALLSARLVDYISMSLRGINPVSGMDASGEKYDFIENAYFMKDLNQTLRNLDDKEKRAYLLSTGIEFFNKIQDITSKMIDVETRLVGEALTQLKLPNSIIQYSEAKEELNNGILNNRILNQKIAFLTNEHMVKGGSNAIAYQVASLTALTDLLDQKNPNSLINLLKDENGELPEEIKNIMIESNVNVNTLRGKFLSFKNNKEGARNIGPAVNSMQTYAVFNTFGIDLLDYFIDPKSKEQIKLWKFKLNGNEFNSYKNTNSYNPLTGKYDSFERIFNVISTIVSAMTDNAKERLAARLGLNTEAVGYVSNLVAQGVPLKSAIAFILQPVVREYFKQTSVLNNNLKTNEEAQSFKSEIAKSLYAELKDLAGDEYQKVDLTDDILISNIKDNGSSATYQLSVLEDFMGLIEQSRYFSSVSKILKLTKGLGTDFDNYEDIKEVIDQLGLKIKDDKEFSSHKAEDTKTPPPFDLRQLFMGYDKKAPHHKFIKRYLEVADQIDQLSKSMFTEKTDVFKRIESIVRANLNVKFNLKETFNKELKRDLLSYLSIKIYQKSLKDNGRAGTLSTMTNALIYDDAAVAKGPEFMDIIDTVKSIRQTIPKNYLAEYLLNIVSTTKVDAEGNIELNPLNRDGINKAEVNTWAKLSELQIEKIRDSFIEIYQSEKDFNGKNGREIANALFNYILVKDGGQFRSGSFIRYIPNFMFDELLISSGKANDLLKLTGNAEQLDQKYKDLFGVTGSELFIEFMENYVTHVGNSPYVTIKPVNNKSTFEATNSKIANEFEPQSLEINEDTISINIFKGIRKKGKEKEITLEEYATLEVMEDWEYNEFIESLTPEEKAELEKAKKTTNKYNEDEKAMFRKNMKSLADKGFTKNKKGEVKFPYIFRVKNGGYNPDTFYILTSVRKYGDKKVITDSKKFIRKDEEMASGVQATYKIVERKGSKKTFKGGAIFDPVPSTASTARYRASVFKNADNFPGYYQKNSGNQTTEENFMMKYGFPIEAARFTNPAPNNMDNPQYPDKPEFNKLPGKSLVPTMTYAGIGSRETPQEILDQMTAIAAELEEKENYTLNTGVSFKNKQEGADKAFYDGVKRMVNLFSPEKQGSRNKEQAIAKEIHPNPSALTEGGLKLMSRNTNQVFGDNLNTPVDFVLFWAVETDTNRPEGGTGQAVQMARMKGIPTINMANPGWRKELDAVLASLKAPVATKQQKPSTQSTQTTSGTLRSGRKILASYGIYMNLVNGKVVFEGAFYDELVKAYPNKSFNTPSQILEQLGESLETPVPDFNNPESTEALNEEDNPLDDSCAGTNIAGEPPTATKYTLDEIRAMINSQNIINP